MSKRKKSTPKKYKSQVRESGLAKWVLASATVARRAAIAKDTEKLINEVIAASQKRLRAANRGTRHA